MSEFIRVWSKIDLKDVTNHLLIVGDLSGECSGCNELGINYIEAKICPNCKADFKYISTRTREVGRIIQKRPDLIFIDYEDYKKAIGKMKARDFFA